MARVVGFQAKVPDAEGGGAPRTGAPVEFIIDYAVRAETIRRFYAGIVVTDSSGYDILTCSTSMVNADFLEVSGAGKVICHLPYLPLKPGRYWVNVKLCEYTGPAHYRKMDEVNHAAAFEVTDGGDTGFFDYPKSAVVMPHHWSKSPEAQSAMDEGEKVARLGTEVYRA
jgi:hypothetical protein